MANMKLLSYCAAMYLSVLCAALTSVCLGQAELDRSARDSFRKLQQSSSSDTDSSSDSSEPVLVSTAAGLREAVGSGARDIRITNHLDLTGMQGFGVLDQGNIPGWQLRSIRGDCKRRVVPASVTREPLLKRKARQCVLKVDMPFVILKTDGLWLDNLYFQEGTDLRFSLVAQFETPSDLYLTSCTFQGTSQDEEGPFLGGLLAKNTYAEGCNFVDLVTKTGRPVVLDDFKGTRPLASFKSCTFNNVARGDNNVAPSIVIRSQGSLRLEDCTLKTLGSGNATIVSSGGFVYSDDLDLIVTAPASATPPSDGSRRLQQRELTVLSLDAIPQSLKFLTGDDELISEAREANPDPEDFGLPVVTSTDDLPPSAIAGIAVGAILLLCCFCGCIRFWFSK